MSDDCKHLNSPSNQQQHSNSAPRQGWEKLTAKYLSDLPRQLDGIMAILETGDYAKVRSQAHRIKGTSGTYRLETISRGAAQLESEAESRNPDKIVSAINNVKQLVKIEIDRRNSHPHESTNGAREEENG